MINLSPTLTDDRVWRCVAVTPTRKFEPAFTNPFDAELASDTEAYRKWLLAQFAQPTTQTYKDAAKLAYQHAAGNTVVLQIHENAQHGNILRAALLSLASTLDHQPQPVKPKRPHAGGLELVSDNIEDQATEIDCRRFVWIFGQDGCAKLGYIWDTEALITALVPDFGLIKIGRLRPSRMIGLEGEIVPVGNENFYMAQVQGMLKRREITKKQAKEIRYKKFAPAFWAQRHLIQLTPRVRVAPITDIGECETTFIKLIAKQRAAEGFVNERTESHNPDRYDWHNMGHSDLQEELDIEPEASELEELHADEFAAYLSFHNKIGTNLTAYWQPRPDPSIVRPVIKRTPAGETLILTALRQIRGVNHLYANASELIALVNLKTYKGDPADLTYIGRTMRGRAGSALGNPYKLTSEEQRGATLDRYKKWLWQQMQSDTDAHRELRRLTKLVIQGSKITLACWCSPQPCHGQVVKDAILYLICNGLV